MLIRTSRRSFLRGTLSSSALVALAPVVPQFLVRASARASEKRGDTVLVVVQMTGGNDALNTLVPYADDAYRKHRPGLGIAGGQVLKVDDYVGLHPSMTGFEKLLEAGWLGIVQGVGYPNPDRSHFQSMDVWHTAAREPVDHRATGWLGRGLDAGAAHLRKAGATDVPGLHLGGSRLPLALVGEQPRVVSVQSVEGFKLDDGGDAELRRTIERAAAARRDGGDDLVTFMHDSTRAALASSARVQHALVDYKTDVKYPG